jgi:hypothetical protein
VLQTKYRERIYYSDSQKAAMRKRWQKGESQQQIAQLFDRNHSSIQRILAESGGIMADSYDMSTARQPFGDVLATKPRIDERMQL